MSTNVLNPEADEGSSLPPTAAQPRKSRPWDAGTLSATSWPWARYARLPKEGGISTRLCKATARLPNSSSRMESVVSCASPSGNSRQAKNGSLHRVITTGRPGFSHGNLFARQSCKGVGIGRKRHPTSHCSRWPGLGLGRLRGAFTWRPGRHRPDSGGKQILSKGQLSLRSNS